MPMIRKQIYITSEDEAKLKRLTASRGCSEAELVREALDLLPETEDRGVAALREAGLLLVSGEPWVSDKDLADIEREWGEAARRVGDIDLSGAVIADREERDASLAGHIRDDQGLRRRAAVG